MLIAFSQMVSTNRPPNLRLMSSFPNPVLGHDGVHLTSFSGLEYLIHLFDSSETIMDGLDSSPEDVLTRQCESTRVLEDRVLVIEKEQQRLNKVIENKIAIDSELADFRENERTEDCFMIEGLPLIPSEIVGKEWQLLAIKHVKEVITPLMGRDVDIIVVQNATARYQGAPVKYSVKLSSVADSRAIRTKFGSFFVGSKDARPPQFKPYSIRNRITPETKVRIEVLKLLGSRYRSSNPGSKVQIIGHDPRPRLKITPSASATDRRIKVYNYIEAVQTFPTNFSASEVDSILKKVNNPKLLGKMRSIFIVLSDDDYRKKSFKQGSQNAGSVEASDEVVSGANTTPISVPGSGHGSKSGSGSKSKSGSGSKSSKRNDKRPADTSLEAAPAKK